MKYIDDYVIFGMNKLLDETFKFITFVLETRKEKILNKDVVCGVHKTEFGILK